jgi:DNA polymerase I
MYLYDTSKLDEASLRTMPSTLVSNIYNGLDCCVTFEIYERLMEELSAEPDCVRQTYEDALRKAAPFLEMSMRGILVDFEARDASIKSLQKTLDELNTRFQAIMVGTFGAGLNWRSPLQVKNLFYGMLGLQPIKRRNTKGIYAPTVDEEALLKLQTNFFAEPFSRYILAMREIGKKISFLQTSIDPDGRFRTSLNIAGTNTGRTSSSASDFGTGSNLQNVDTTLRYPFIADPGMIFVNVDLEQADARNLGAILWNMFVDEYGEAEAGRFLDFCESGDLHTRVCRMTWQELPWGDDEKMWRAIADLIYTSGLSYRDMAKKLGHGSNYLGTPRTMAMHTKTAVQLIEDFQRRYFGAFPLIPEWHKRRIFEIKNYGTLTTMYGRRRHFFGRGDDAATHREAIAYEPQSMTGHSMDMGIINLFENMPEAQLLVQVHDSILFQLPFKQLSSLLPRALELLRFEWTLARGRKFSIPLEAKTGWNWGNVEFFSKRDAPSPDLSGKIKSNPHGLSKWKGKEERLPPNRARSIRDMLK